jgi:16S rRNA (cytosine967-C5)-methyltransferase
LSPWGFEVGKPEDLIQNPAYQRGLFQIHDEASQLISLMMNSRPGQRILDLNAGEGQNALAISAMMRNKGSLFVYDPDQKKMKAFKERAAKAGIDNFRILTDSQIAEVKSLDAALIAAPSSGSGALAYNPELKWKFNKDELPRIQKLQAALLREGARKLKLGGYLIYATHSLSKSENEMQLDHFIKSTHSSFRIVPASQYLKENVLPYAHNFFNFTMDEKLLASLLEQDPYIFMSPDIHSTKGSFIGIIQRIRIST